MIKKTPTLALILCSALLPTLPAYADSPYVSLDLGIYGAGQDNNLFDNIFDNDDDTRGAARLAVGYQWDVAPPFVLGLEAGINGFQHHEKNSTIRVEDHDIRARLRYSRFSADLLAVFDYYLLPCFDLFLKAGAVYAHQEASAKHEDIRISRDHKDFTGKLAIGAGYAFNKNWSLNLSLHHEFEIDNHYEDIKSFPSATSLLLGVKYNFV